MGRVSIRVPSVTLIGCSNQPLAERFLTMTRFLQGFLMHKPNLHRPLRETMNGGRRTNRNAVTVTEVIVSESLNVSESLR